MSTEIEDLKDIKNSDKIAIYLKKFGTGISVTLSTLALIAVGGVYFSNKDTQKVERFDSSSLEQKLAENSKQIESLQQAVKNQEDISELKKKLYQAMSDQDKAQSQSIAMLQNQIKDINSTIVSPSKDIYSELAILNAQAAIDYFTLAKDVVLFTDDTAKADSLVDVAFQKLELVPAVQIGAADRQQLEDDLANIKTKETTVKQFIAIEKQINNLTLSTAENIAETNKATGGKVVEYFNSMVQIQDIPKKQKILATKESKQFVSNSVYITLIQLQNSLYTNDQARLDTTKKTLIELLKQYFVQDAEAKDAIQKIESLQLNANAKAEKDFDSFIDKLVTFQNQMIAGQKSKKSGKGE